MAGSGKAVIIGQGYVGLPVSMRAVEMGYSVIGLDIDERRTASLNEGISYVEDIPHAQLQAALASGRFRATTSYDDASGFDYAIITVPTPLKDSLPDLTFIEDSGGALAPHLTPGATVVLESTTYPGTTEELLVPILEAGSGLKAGTDFYVGYSPERIDPGNKKFGFVETPKVVAGIDEGSLAKVDAFYSSLIDQTVPVSGTKEAELTKLLENTFRHVNIALVNELAVFSHQLGIDVWEAIEAADSKPFGFMKFTPGPGVGGHCLPVDPSYLSWQVRRQLGANFRFVELANDVNDHMPNYVIDRLIRLLNAEKKSINGSRIVLVGLAYKRDTGDIRESPSIKIIELLKALGAEIAAADPLIEPYRWPEGVEKVEYSAQTLAGADAVLCLTVHSVFDKSILENSPVPVLDTQHAVRGANIETL